MNRLHGIKSQWPLIFAGLALETLFIVFRLVSLNPAQTVIKYMAVHAAAFIALLFFVQRIKKQEFSRFFFPIVLIFSLVFGLTLLTAPPNQSDDIYRYLWDGKLQYSGINPYTYAPGDPALSPYHSDTLPGLVNFPHIKTIYPPVAQLVFRLSFSLFGESIAGLKFLFLLAALGSIGLFYSILNERGGEVHWLLLFAWNPLLVMETAVNGHLDILMVFFLLLGLWLFYKNRPVLSAFAMACAVLSKLIPAVLLPVFLFYFLAAKEKKIAGVLRFFIPFLFTISFFYAFYIESAQNMFLTALNYSSKWYFNNPLFMVILELVKTNAAAHLVSFLLFVLVCPIIWFRPFSLEQKIFYTAAAFVALNPTIHPWYLILLLGLLCIHPSRATVLWSGLVVASYIVVYRFKLTGAWEDSWLVMSVEYLPLVLCLRRPGALLKKRPWTPQNF